MKKDRNAEVARALRDGQCQHHPASDCRDQKTGDIFCGDCGTVKVPWSQQTEREQATYRWIFSAEPPEAVA